MEIKESIKPYIIHCIIMRMSEKEALSYLADRGFTISMQYYYKLKKDIKESRFERLSLIAKEGFIDSHLERIDQLELINKEYWILYRDTKDTFKKAQILEKIAELQTYISAYYSASKRIMEVSIQEPKQEPTAKKKRRKNEASI
jgi:hypothetical protein